MIILTTITTLSTIIAWHLQVIIIQTHDRDTLHFPVMRQPARGACYFHPERKYAGALRSGFPEETYYSKKQKKSDERSSTWHKWVYSENKNTDNTCLVSAVQPSLYAALMLLCRSTWSCTMRGIRGRNVLLKCQTQKHLPLSQVNTDP